MSRLMFIFLVVLLGAAVVYFGRHGKLRRSAPGAAQEPTSAMSALITHYEAIRASLANDTVDGVDANAKAIVRSVEAARRASENLSSEKRAKLDEILNGIKRHASALEGKKLDEARKIFGHLSDSMIGYVESFKDPADGQRYHIFNCPMAKRSWIQGTTDMGNPYYGPSMLKCGSLLASR